MTREEAKRRAELYSALAEGKIIQFKQENGEWTDLKTDLMCGIAGSFRYRIKPESEPKYRPFANAEECLQEMMKHQPFGWITSQGAFFYIIYIEDKLFGYGSACGTILHSEFNDVLKSFTFADGTPFGVKIEDGYNGIK